jgi:TonB-linked SusC/RagA family outer membrane protein
MKNNYRRSLALKGIFALFLTYTSPTFSQNQPQKTIRGIITDGAAPLSGVNVLVKNSARGSISDLEGWYSVSASANDTLVFTYVGYKMQEVAVGSGPILNVVMEVDAQALDAVVINAGYYKVTDREKTGSISRVTAEEIEKQPVNNPLEALQGRAAGVVITPTTGLPGGGVQVRIRGQSSIAAGNEPLFVVDGIPIDSQSMSNGYTSTPLLPDGNVSPLNNISPSEIESIEILKDADATAIYGSRGANGVVLITTKEGKAGKTRYNIKWSSSLGHVTRFQKLLNTQQYLKMRREAFANDGITEYPEYEYDINGTWDQNRYTDWQKELIGETAYRNTIQGDVSGGGEQTRFLLSGEYTTETTVFPDDSKFNRASVHTAINHSDKAEKFTLKFTAHYGIENNTLPARDQTIRALNLPPNAPALYDEDGELNWENGTFTNPLGILNGNYLLNRKTLLSNLALHYEIIPQLGIRVNTGYENSNLNESRTNPNTVYDPSFGLGSEYSTIFVNKGARNSWIAEPQVDWNTSFLGGKLSALVGGSFQQKTAAILSYVGQGFASNDLIYDLAAASFIQIDRDEETKYKYEAVYGRLNYNWHKKYIVNLTGRRDGSSRFGPGRKFSNFGAVGAAWVFSEEAFFKNSNWLYTGKLRGSYGSTGNDQIGDYGYLDTYTVSGTPYGGIIGIGPTQLYNPNLGWEINKKGSLALELAVWDNCVSLTAEWYKSRSGNQLVGIPLAYTTGFPSVQANLGAIVENRGWEISLSTVNIKNDDFNWTTDFNITIPQNELVAFPGLENSTYANQFVIGEPITIKKVFHYTGIDTETGIYQFEDYNGDGNISAPDDQQYTEGLAPEFYGGISNVLKYRNWNLSFFFQFSKQKAYNQWYSASPAGTMGNQPTDVLDHWENTGDNAQTQLYTSGYNVEATNAFYNFISSDAAISDASYIRLKNLALSYAVPIDKVAAKIFLQGQNLITFTSFKGGDPEQFSGFLPPLRWLGGGIQLTF